MKPKKLIGVIASIFILNGCSNTKEIVDCFVGTYDYGLIVFSFHDASGNDLIKGIDYEWRVDDAITEDEARGGRVMSGLYFLEIIYPDPKMGVTYYGSSDLCLVKTKGVYYLFFQFASDRGIPPADVIAIKLRCPHIFGDDGQYEIATHWKLNYEYLDCYGKPYSNSLQKIKFEGKEVASTVLNLFDDEHIVVWSANIIIDR